MSWIFSFLLGCYVLVRLALRLRGKLRWLAIRDTLPRPPSPVAPPRDLSEGLTQLFEGSRQLRIALTLARRTLMTVRVTDPDAALGRVRDARYRRAVMESWTLINRWLRGLRELPPADLGTLQDLHLGPAKVEQLRDSLRACWGAVARARALDLFELEDLQHVLETLEQIDVAVQEIERGLEHAGDDPYRDRLLARPGVGAT